MFKTIAFILVFCLQTYHVQGFYLSFESSNIGTKLICQSDFIDNSVKENVEPQPYISCPDGAHLQIVNANVTVSKPDKCPLQIGPNTTKCKKPAELGNTDISKELQLL